MSECDACNREAPLIIYKFVKITGNMDIPILDDIRICAECFTKMLKGTESEGEDEEPNLLLQFQCDSIIDNEDDEDYEFSSNLKEDARE